MACLLDCAEEQLIGANSEEKAKLTPGSYKSTLVKAYLSPDWANGKAVELIYKVEVQEGKFVEKKSVMMTSTKNKRTKEFVAYLRDHDVKFKDFEELIGLHEVLTFKYDEVNDRRYLNIFGREFIGFVEVE